MTIEALLLLSLVLFGGLRFLIAPSILKAAISGDGTVRPFLIGLSGVALTLSIAALFSFLGAALVATWLMSLRFGVSIAPDLNLAQVSGLIDTARSLIRGASSIQAIGAGLLGFLALAALVYLGFRARHVQVRSVLERELQARVREAVALIESGQIDVALLSDDKLTDLARVREIGEQTAKGEKANDIEAYRSLIVEKEQLLRRLLPNALAQLGPVAFNADTFRPAPPRTLLGRLGALFISGGLSGGIGLITRGALFASALLATPAMLHFSGVENAAGTRTAVLLSELGAAELDVAQRTQADKLMAAVSDAEAQEGASSTQTPAVTDNQAALDNAADILGDCRVDNPDCDAVLIDYLATAFEQAAARRAFAEFGIPPPTSTSDRRRNFVAHGVFEASAGRPGGGDPFSPPPHIVRGISRDAPRYGCLLRALRRCAGNQSESRFPYARRIPRDPRQIAE